MCVRISLKFWSRAGGGRRQKSSVARASLCSVWLFAAASVLSLFCSAGARAAQATDCDSPEQLQTQAEHLRGEWKEASLREAITKYEKAAGCWRDAGRALEQSVALRWAGDISLTLSEHQKARSFFDASKLLLEAGGNGAALAETLSGLTLALIYLGEIDQAQAAADRAISLARASGQSRVEAHALASAGMLCYMRGDIQGALGFYENALPLSKRENEPADTAQILLYIGYVYGEMGELDKALNFYNQALSLWRAAKHRGGEASTLTSMGLAYTILGDRQQALSYLSEQALPILREVGDRLSAAATYNNIGYFYQTLGDYQQALENYNRAFDLFEQIGLVQGLALTIQYVGIIHELSGRPREALDCYERSLVWSRQAKHVLIEADALNHLGNLYYAVGRKQEAIDYYRRALATYQQAKQLRGQATALNNIGYYFDALGQSQKALENYDQALSLCKLTRDQDIETLTLYNIARARRARGDLDGAREAVESAINISETLRLNITNHELRASYFASVHQLFDFYVAVLMDLSARPDSSKASATAFEASERGRARSLLETLAESRNNIRGGADQTLLGREQALTLQLKAKAERRVQLLGRKANEQELIASERELLARKAREQALMVTERELTAIEQELEELTTQYQQVQGQIRFSSPRYAALVQPVPLSLSEIQQRVLDADTILLEYSLGVERSFVWAVTSDSIKPFTLPPRAEVERAARQVYKLLTERNKTVKGEKDAQRSARLALAEAEYPAAAAALSRMILGPVAGELGSKRIVVVGDGALQYVPFATLPDPSAAGKNAPTGGPPPLIVGHEVLSLPSASVLALLRNELRGRPSAPKSVAVLADPVFNSDDERLRVATTAAGRSARSSGAESGGASEQKLNSLAMRSLRSFDEGGEGGFRSPSVLAARGGSNHGVRARA